MEAVPWEGGGGHSFYCWWRSAPGFDAEGRPGLEAKAGDVSTMAPRERVLRELERLALLGTESLDNARRRLIAYRPGDLWVPTGGVARNEMEIPEVATILVVGAVGSGKSSLVNLMHSVLGRAGLIPLAYTSPSGCGKGGGTRCLEEHNVLRSAQSGFCVFDTRGFEYDSLHEGLKEMAGWVGNGVRHRQICHGASPTVDGSRIGRRKYARRMVNFIIVVADMAEIYKSYKVGDSKPLEATREIFSTAKASLGSGDPILVLTHGDRLSTEERLEARLQICKKLEISETVGAYDIACLNEYGVLVDECDPTTAYCVAEAVYRAVLLSDQHLVPKWSFKDRLLAFLYWITACLANFFAFLSNFFSRFGDRDHKLKFA